MSQALSRLPVYLVLDCSGSMAGEPIESVRQGIRALLADLRTDPLALETVYLSVITFANSAEQVCPLTELALFQEPTLTASGSTALGAALSLLIRCVEAEVRKPDKDHKGDWKPLIFLMTDGVPTDSWESAAEEFTARRLGRVMACAAGDADIAVLGRLTGGEGTLIQLKGLQPVGLRQSLRWLSSSIKTTTDGSSGGGVQVPQPPVFDDELDVPAYLRKGGIAEEHQEQQTDADPNSLEGERAAIEGLISDPLFREVKEHGFPPTPEFPSLPAVEEEPAGQHPHWGETENQDLQAVIEHLARPAAEQPQSPPSSPTVVEQPSESVSVEEIVRELEAELGGLSREDADTSPSVTELKSQYERALALLYQRFPDVPRLASGGPTEEVTESTLSPDGGQAVCAADNPPNIWESAGAAESEPRVTDGTKSIAAQTAKAGRIEDFRCSAFYPERALPDTVCRLIASVHLSQAADVAVREASKRLGLPAGVRIAASSEKPSHPITRNIAIDVTVDAPGLIFENSSARLQVWEDHQSVEFRFRIDPDHKRPLCQGRVHFWLSGVILADINLSILIVEESAPDIFKRQLAEANARPYRLVFPSYSHEDSEIVDRLEAYAAAFGDEYLRDVRSLRAGQRWNRELCGFIERADVFQLFWSDRASQSAFVADEWRYALRERASRPDPHFVRPVYWTPEPAPIPEALQAIHFARLPL